LIKAEVIDLADRFDIMQQDQKRKNDMLKFMYQKALMKDT